MSWLFHVLLVTAVAALLAAVVGWRHRTCPGARVFIALALAVANAAFCHALGGAATDLASARVWNRAEYLTEVFIPGLLLLLAGRQVQGLFRPRFLAVVFAIPLVALVANWTNEWHGLYYRQVGIDVYGDWSVLHKTRGPLFWLLHVHFFASLASALGLVGFHPGWQRPGMHVQRRAMLLAAMLLTLMDLAHVLQRPRFGVWGFAYSGWLAGAALLTWAVLRWRILDLTPVARRKLLGQMAEAMIQVDREGCIADYNLKAAVWLGCSGAVKGKPLNELPGLGDLRLDSESSRVVECDRRLVRVRLTAVRDSRGCNSGWLLLGRDVTRQVADRTALETANRRLRKTCRDRSQALQQVLTQTARLQEEAKQRLGRDIHDTLCQDLVGLARSAQTLAASGRQNAGSLPTDALAGLAGEASRILRSARSLAHDLALADLEFLSFAEALESFGERAELWLGIQVDVNIDEQVTFPETETARYLVRIVREAIVNACRHGQARHAWVDLVKHEGLIRISITNDGAPVPVPGCRREGLGLRQMRLYARLLGGEIAINNVPDGLVCVHFAMPVRRLDQPTDGLLRCSRAARIRSGTLVTPSLPINRAL